MEDLNEVASPAIEELLKALGSPSWRTVRDAAVKIGAALKSGSLADDGPKLPLKSKTVYQTNSIQISHFGRLIFLNGAQRRALDSALCGVAHHPKWEVRKAVANAMLYVRSRLSEKALVDLVDDKNAVVKKTAKDTQRKRANDSQLDPLGIESAKLMADDLEKIEQLGGLKARDAATAMAKRMLETVFLTFKHEFKKPIAATDLAAAGLEREYKKKRVDRKKCVEYVDRIRGQQDRASAIIESVSTFTRQVVPDFHPHNLREVLEHSLNSVCGAFMGAIEVSINCDEAIVVEMHRAQLVEAFVNVMANGAESHIGTGRSPTLQVDARVDRGEVVVEVTDSGCGMNEEDQQGAMEMWNTRKVGGTGLGLPIVKNIMWEHRGTLSLRSAVDEGTTAVMRLPVERESHG